MHFSSEWSRNVAQSLLCVFRCHQSRVVPAVGGQQLAHTPDAYDLPLPPSP